MSVRSFQQIADEADAVANLGVKLGYWLGRAGDNGREEVNGLTIGSVYRVVAEADCFCLEDDDGDSRLRLQSEFKIVG